MAQDDTSLSGDETRTRATAADIRAASRDSGMGDRGAATRAGSGEPSLETIMRIPVVLQVVLGSTNMPVANLMKLGRGQVVALDHRVGEPVDIVVNGRVIARGEVVVVDDDTSRFGVSLTEIVGPGATADR